MSSSRITPSQQNFPLSPSEITTPWLSSVLRKACACGDGDLSGRQILATPEGYGVAGSHARLQLRYSRPLPEAPDSLYAKFSCADPASRARYHRLGIYERENRFYKDVAPFVKLRVPRCYFAALDPISGQSLVILEDLKDGRVVDGIAGCSTEEISRLLQAMAGFHAQWWEHPSLSEWIWLHRDPDSLVDPLRRAWPLFRQRYSSLLSEWGIKAGEQALERAAEILRLSLDSPATVVHGDFKLDNVLFDLTDAPFAVLDWHAVFRGRAAADISWFLIRSLPVVQRRADEASLISTYHAALVEAGVNNYSLRAFKRDVEIGALRTFLVMMISFLNADESNERRMQDVSASIGRLMAMLEDHDVWGAL